MDRDVEVLVLGLNPALQKTLRFDKLDVGSVNRAHSVHYGTGGKGQNTARALNLLRGSPTCVLHPLGGTSGDKVEAMLQADSIPQVVVHVSGETRTCTTLAVEGHSTTELIDPSAPIFPEERAALIAEIDRFLAGPRLCAVMLCGSFPKGLEGVYEHVARQKRNGLWIFLDGTDAGTLAAGVDVLKINADEIRVLCPGHGSLEACAREVHRRFLVPTVAVTDGKEPGLVSSSAGGEVHQWWVHPGMLEQPRLRSPIGAGDACSAGFLAALVAGRSPAEAFAEGQAVGSASCLTDQCSSFDLNVAHEMRRQVRIESC
jgi:1-phosphofructokinase